MFSGIIEEAATVVALQSEKDNLHISLRCSFTHELKIDQSVSHNGVCLTVVDIKEDVYTVTAIKETLDKSNLGLLKVGDRVNVERSMPICFFPIGSTILFIRPRHSTRRIFINGYRSVWVEKYLQTATIQIREMY